MSPFWSQTLEMVSFAFELVGVVIVGYSGVLALRGWIGAEWFRLKGEEKGSSEAVRKEFAQKIVLGLEFFIAGDIIKTMFAPSWSELGRLGAIVVIRTVLHYSMSR